MYILHVFDDTLKMQIVFLMTYIVISKHFSSLFFLTEYLDTVSYLFLSYLIAVFSDVLYFTLLKSA